MHLQRDEQLELAGARIDEQRADPTVGPGAIVARLHLAWRDGRHRWVEQREQRVRLPLPGDL